MIPADKIQTYLTRYPLGGAAAYAALVIGCVAATALLIVDVAERRNAAAAAADFLSQLEGRGAGARPCVAPHATGVPGSPLLEGATVTVAGAALLQRVVGAVGREGGNVLSSQVDLQGPQAKQGFIVVTASCELEQTALQRLLYDLEAGMPFLFVEQLTVQAPAASAADTSGPGPKLRVLVSVSGQWQGVK